MHPLIDPCLKSASVATLQSCHAIDPYRSMAGHISFLGKSERWPLYDGLAMFPFCQILMQDLPVVPEPLRPYALITVFLISYPVDGEVHCGLPRYCDPEDAQYVIRAYRTLDETVVVDRSGYFETEPRLLQFTRIDDDAPPIERIPIPAGTDLRALQKALRREYRTHRGFKVGGYPQLWQDPFDGIEDYVIQLGVLAFDCSWGDEGNAYVMLDAAGRFSLQWQSS